MSRVIFKYQLEHITIINLPERSEVVHVGHDPRGIKSIWVLQDESLAKIDYTFVIKGTGHEIKDNLWHIGTFNEGIYVWHVFQKL